MKTLRFAIIVSVCLGSMAFTPAPARAENTSFSADVAELKDQLLNGLRAGRPEDREYINKIAAMVDSGALPRELVVTTFIWAKRKKYHRVQYFQRALTHRAALIGIRV